MVCYWSREGARIDWGILLGAQPLSSQSMYGCSQVCLLQPNPCVVNLHLGFSRIKGRRNAGTLTHGPQKDIILKISLPIDNPTKKGHIFEIDFLSKPCTRDE